jgi:hypothetical protein
MVSKIEISIYEVNLLKVIIVDLFKIKSKLYFIETVLINTLTG